MGLYYFTEEQVVELSKIISSGSPRYRPFFSDKFINLIPNTVKKL